MTQSLTDTTPALKALVLVNSEGGGRLSTSICLEQTSQGSTFHANAFFPPCSVLIGASLDHLDHQSRYISHSGPARAMEPAIYKHQTSRMSSS